MDSNTGKKVAISAMAVALLGTSGYITYDKVFKKTDKEQVKLANSTDTKDDRITGNNNLQSMFPSVLADPNKLDDKKTNDASQLDLANLLANTKSPITPVTYNPNEIQVAKKEPEIKLNDKPDLIPPPGLKLPGTDPDPKPPVPPGPGPDPDPKPPVPPGPGPGPDPDPDPKPPVDRTGTEINISPKTGDILIDWYGASGEKYSTVFFSAFYGQSQNPDKINGMLNDMANNFDPNLQDLTLVSQQADSNAPAIARNRLEFDNLSQVLNYNFESSDDRKLFYIRNQIYALNQPGMNEQWLKNFLTTEKEKLINILANAVFVDAQKAEKKWRNDRSNTEALNQAFSKYYLITALLPHVDDKLIGDANQQIESIFKTMLDDELQKMKIQSASAVTQPTVQDKKDRVAKKEDSIDEIIAQIKHDLDPASPNYENALMLADKWIDHPMAKEKRSELEDCFNQAVTKLVEQINNPNTSFDDALRKANLLVHVARVEKTIQDDAMKLSLSLMYEVKANEAFTNGDKYTAVLYMANSLRAKNPFDRAKKEMEQYASGLMEQADLEWSVIKDSPNWQHDVSNSVLPSYILLAQLKDIDSTIPQIDGVGQLITEALGKVEGIQLLNIANIEANKGDSGLSNALHYYGQAAARKVLDKNGLVKVVSRYLEQARNSELDPSKESYTDALHKYQILYSTPGVNELDGFGQIKTAIDYLSTYDAAKKTIGENPSIENLATAIALAHEAIAKGYSNPNAVDYIKTTSEKLYAVGIQALNEDTLDKAYKCFEFLTRTAKYQYIPSEYADKAKEGLQKIKEKDAKK